MSAAIIESGKVTLPGLPSLFRYSELGFESIVKDRIGELYGIRADLVTLGQGDGESEENVAAGSVADAQRVQYRELVGCLADVGSELAKSGTLPFSEKTRVEFEQAVLAHANADANAKLEQIKVYRKRTRILGWSCVAVAVAGVVMGIALSSWLTFLIPAIVAFSILMFVVLDRVAECHSRLNSATATRLAWRSVWLSSSALLLPKSLLDQALAIRSATERGHLDCYLRLLMTEREYAAYEARNLEAYDHSNGRAGVCTWLSLDEEQRRGILDRPQRYPMLCIKFLDRSFCVNVWADLGLTDN